MSRERRLNDLERSLDPKAYTKDWLDELHGFSDLIEYTAAVVAGPSSANPLRRIGFRAGEAVRNAMRGLPEDEIDDAQYVAMRDGAFLYFLAMGLIEAAQKLLDIAPARWQLHHWMYRADELVWTRASESTEKAEVAARWPQWRGTLAGNLYDLYLEEEVRTLLEDRYLDGHPTVFSEMTEQLRLIRTEVEQLAEAGWQLTGSQRDPGDRSPETFDADRLRNEARASAETNAEVIVGFARAQTLDLMGESQGRSLIAEQVTRWAERWVADLPRAAAEGGDAP